MSCGESDGLPVLNLFIRIVHLSDPDLHWSRVLCALGADLELSPGEVYIWSPARLGLSFACVWMGHVC